MPKKKIEATASGQWVDIGTKVYKDGAGSSFKNIVRRALIDNQYPDVSFELRYFEISKSGYSSFEKHEHPHTVIIGKGNGKAIVGDEIFEAKPFDIFYIAPNQPHQFQQCGEEPFGFFCMVPKERDKPELLGEAEKEKLKKKIEFKD